MANRDIPPERKALHTFGLALSGLGALMFFSVFVTGALHFGDFGNGSQFGDFSEFKSRARSEGLRAVGGMGCIIAGVVIMGVARQGLAGSGVVLDPQQARKDVEPLARMTGGILKDTLDEAGFDLSKVGGAAPEPDFADKIRKLHELYKDGIITEEEFLREKEDILARN